MRTRLVLHTHTIALCKKLSKRMRQIGRPKLQKCMLTVSYRCNKCLYLVRKKEVNFILSYYTNLSHTGQEKFTSFFRIVYTRVSILNWRIFQSRGCRVPSCL